MKKAKGARKLHPDDRLVKDLCKECNYGIRTNVPDDRYDRYLYLLAKAIDTLLFRTRVIMFLFFVLLGSLLTLLIEHSSVLP